MGPMGSPAMIDPVPGAGPQPGMPGAPMDVGTLIGQVRPPTPTVDPQGIARSVMTQIRDLQAGAETLARQFPDTADLVADIKRLLIQVMTKAVGSLGGPEASQAPPVLG